MSGHQDREMMVIGTLHHLYNPGEDVMGPGVETSTEDECKEERPLKEIREDREVHTHVGKRTKRPSHLGGA